MSQVTAAQVRELRNRTGAGMMECKKALVEANGDLEQAEVIIAKSGHKKAQKSAGRTAAEGIILLNVANDGASAIALEVNCETDFVARDGSFKSFAESVAQLALSSKETNVEKLAECKLPSGESIEDARKALIAKIGENIQVRRAQIVESPKGGKVGAYSHDGRIGVLVALDSDNDGLAKDIAMHVAAMKPLCLKPEQVPQEKIDQEKEIFMAQAKASGKPDNIIEKMIVGRMNKFLNEICLIGQPFVKDQDKTIGALLKENNSDIASYLRFEVGEGIEVVKKSFQEEVMEQARGN